MTAAPTSRYLVGIDLGTTNCAMAYVDTSLPEAERVSRVFPLAQIVAPGEVDRLPTLPSFVYLPEPAEMDGALLRLPWSRTNPDFCVGTYARNCAAKAPAKVVSSAKSWLCCDGVDRRADILPFDRAGAPRRISPVAAAQKLLEHMRDAWDYEMSSGDPDAALSRQDVYITVPASFDAVARELTMEAASAAGLSVRLLEEPQAAFYAWLHEQGDTWRDYLAAGDRVLVCDIGGGTTDFSLIEVTDEDGSLGLARVAVGDHILLGGDNMDLALAYGTAERLKRERNLQLDSWQLAALTHQCREAKEHLVASSAAPRTLAILGRGRSVIGASISVELAPAATRAAILDGFFPVCSFDEAPSARRKVGLRSRGGG